MDRNLETVRKIQDRIFLEDCIEFEQQQNFLYFLGNHKYLFREFDGHITNAEINYIVEHFYDYTVDPRTFANEFKRALRETLPRYNILKSIELKDDIFELFDDKWTRDIISDRLQTIAENGTKTSQRSDTSSDNTKNANRELPMASTGRDFENTVRWNDGASNISESKTAGSSTISQNDVDNLQRAANESGNTKETYTRERTPVDTVDRIWNYILKPKAIEYLTSELQYAFNLVY